jgi:hypothetical protein
MSTEAKKVSSHDATNRNESPANTFDGKVVSITGDQLVMTNGQEKEYALTLAKDARLTCDGTVCEADKLKVGSRIRVTTKKDVPNSVTRIESLHKDTEFARRG